MLVPDLRALRDKYERMRRLRELHARARADASFVEPDPRAAMAELARDFPGALREIDELPMQEIARRIDAISAAELDPSRAEPWMRAHVVFHRLARGALATKRWLADHDAAHFLAALAALPPEAALWEAELGAIDSPPRGRLMDVVRARLARELGIADEEVRALLGGRAAGAAATRRRP